MHANPTAKINPSKKREIAYLELQTLARLPSFVIINIDFGKIGFQTTNT